MESKKASNSQASNSNHKKILIIVFVLTLAIIVGAVVTIDLSWRARYKTVVGAIENIDRQLNTVDAVAYPGEERRGDGLWSVMGCWPDVACPTASDSWYVPLEQGKEKQLFIEVLERDGYDISTSEKAACSIGEASPCSITGTKSDHSVNVTIQSPPAQSPDMPMNDVTPKLWRLVSVRAKVL